MQLKRPKTQTTQISLVSMIDVLMIMLIYFMVTSTYLRLGMIPMADQRDDPAPVGLATTAPGGTLLIRIAPDGSVRARGRPQTATDLTRLFAAHLATTPNGAVLVLPSGNANTQALVNLLDAATHSGIQNLRVLRLEAAP
jgi:biopolymer transport protein ExbD